MENLIIAARDALTVHEATAAISVAPAKYRVPLTLLHVAAMPSTPQKPQSFATRAKSFDYAMSVLAPALNTYKNMDDDKTHDNSRHEYVADYIENYTVPLKASLHEGALRESTAARVDNSVLTSGEEVIELTDTKYSREIAACQRAAIKKVVATIDLLTDIALKGQPSATEHGTALVERESARREGSQLAAKKGMLMGFDGLLTLTDDDFAREFSSAKGVSENVSNYSEFVTAVTEVIGGSICATAAFAVTVAKATGGEEYISQFSELAEGTVECLAVVISAAEAVHGLAVLFSSNATRAERLDGAVDAFTGATGAVGGGLMIFAAAGSAAKAAGERLVGVAGVIKLEWDQIEFFSNELGKAETGIVGGWMNRSFRRIQQEGTSIASAAEKLAKAVALLARESDPTKSTALLAYIDEATKHVSVGIDMFLDSCAVTSYCDENAVEHPGAYNVLRELFQPLMRFRGVQTAESASVAARATLEKMRWALTHADALVLGDGLKQPLAVVEDFVDKQEQAAQAKAAS